MSIEVRPARGVYAVELCRADLTTAYAGIRKNFERAGFTKAADTTSVLAGHPRVLMRRDLR